MPGKSGFENLQEKAARGEYRLIEPLDYLILGLLPEEGELVMGFYPLAKTVDQLRREKFGALTPGQVAAQLRNMTAQGLATKVHVTQASKGRGYQRTAAGKRVYEEWAAKQAPDTSGGAS